MDRKERKHRSRSRSPVERKRRKVARDSSRSPRRTERSRSRSPKDRKRRKVARHESSRSPIRTERSTRHSEDRERRPDRSPKRSEDRERRLDKSPRRSEDRERRSEDREKSRRDKKRAPKKKKKIDLESLVAVDDDMMKQMGFAGFDTTKNKKVEDNVDGMAKVNKTRKYRQYMNRKGGFNRPLDFIA